MNVKDLMTPNPCTLAVTAELDEAMALMDRRSFRHLPVLEGKRLVGMVSDRDLLSATGWHYGEDRRERFEPSDEGRPRTVRDVMHSPAVTVGLEESLFTLAVKFVTDHVGCLPVMRGDELVGIVSEVDLLVAYERACNNGLIPCEKDGPVSDVMTGKPITVEWHTPLSEAVELSRSTGVRHLPVLESDAVVGMVSDRDLRRAKGLHRVADTMMEEIMSKDVVTVAPDRQLHDVARIINERCIGALPVVRGEELVGIVSTKDLVYHCMTNLSEIESST